MNDAPTFDTRQSRIGRALNEDERALLTHWSRWGSDGYPVHRSRGEHGAPTQGRWWTWDFLSLSAPRRLYPTKRAATAAFEAFVAVLIEASGEEARDRALADLTVRQEAS